MHLKFSYKKNYVHETYLRKILPNALRHLTTPYVTTSGSFIIIKKFDNLQTLVRVERKKGKNWSFIKIQKNMESNEEE